MYSYDVLIIGSGTAGLVSALRLAEQDLQVALLCKGALGEGSSLYAQGGIAAVMDAEDSLNAHVRDTLTTGAGLCDKQAVRHTVTHGRHCIEWLVERGVKFDPNPEAGALPPYHLTLEGGHSFRRILHAHDATGREVQTTLALLVRETANISLFEHTNAVDLIRRQGCCVGAYALDISRNRVETFAAKATILATGGASSAYAYSTNPAVSSGDGIAMAYRAGCRVANMEFNQFHPTSLYHPRGKGKLISEALRGEGGKLMLANGETFMHAYDSRGDLAPRDVVARAIDDQMKKRGLACVYLSIVHRDADFIREHFPNTHHQLLEYGIDITTDAIPVVPAAHYTCGGVMVDRYSRTDLPQLYAAGETSYTGLHGANRMASNSLLECLVYAYSASRDIIRHLPDFYRADDLAPWDEGQVTASQEQVLILHNWDELKKAMWNYMGIVRSNSRLQRAARRIELIREEVQHYYRHYTVNNNLLELRNLILVADLMVRSAQLRHESRGLHYTLDYPHQDPRFACPGIIAPMQTQ